MCGTAGEKKNRLAENWLNQFYQVTDTIFYYLSKLKKSSTPQATDDQTDVDVAKLVPFSDIVEKTDMAKDKISQRIDRLLLVLQNIVGTRMDFEVQFPLLRLVKVFCELSNFFHVDVKDNRTFSVAVVRRTNGALLKCVAVCIRQLKSSLLMFSKQLGLILSSPSVLSDRANRHLLYQCFLAMLDHWTVLPTDILELLLATIYSDISIEELLPSTEVAPEKGKITEFKVSSFSSKFSTLNIFFILCENFNLFGTSFHLKLLQVTKQANNPYYMYST